MSSDDFFITTRKSVNGGRVPKFTASAANLMVHTVYTYFRYFRFAVLTAVNFRKRSGIRYMQDYSTFRQRGMNGCETLKRPVENSIRGKLEAGLKPLHCDVINESYMHNVPKNSETHFKVVVVSEKFDKQPLIKRHRMINQLLQEELQGGVHALSIVAKTLEQWETSNTVAASPACRGGFGK